MLVGQYAITSALGAETSAGLMQCSQRRHWDGLSHRSDRTAWLRARERPTWLRQSALHIRLEFSKQSFVLARSVFCLLVLLFLLLVLLFLVFEKLLEQRIALP